MANSSSDARRRSVEFTANQVVYVDKLIEDGAFTTADDVGAAGLQALRERDAGFEPWLREQVGPTYDRMQTDPSRGLTPDEVRRRLDSRHEARLRAESQCGEP